MCTLARLPIALLVVALVAAGCGDVLESTRIAQVSDSAGVRLVDNEGGAWGDEEGSWRLGEAVLHIGGQAADPEQQLYEVRGGALLPDGRVVLANNGSHDLRFYDRTGRFLRSVGREGQGPGEFGGIWHMVRYAGDSLLVWDNRNMRLSVHDPESTFVRDFKLEASPDGIARFPGMRLISLSDGSILGMEWLGATLMEAEPGILHLETEMFRFDREGRELASIGSFPWSEWYVGDEPVVMPNGVSTTLRAPLMFGKSLFLAAHDSLFWLGTGDAVLLQLDRQGQVAQRVRRVDIDRVAVTDAMVQRQIALQLDAREQMIDDPTFLARFRRLLESMPVADTLPAYESALVDSDGNLWARRHGGIADPDAPRPSSWDVYEPAGRFMGTVALPPRFDPLEIGADYVLGVQRDDLDVEHVFLLPLEKDRQEQAVSALS